MSEIDAFADDARLIFRLAENHARTRGQAYLGTEHVLLALLDDPQTNAHVVLRQLGAEPARVRSAVEFMLQGEAGTVTGPVRFTPRTLTVIDKTIEEANRLGHHPIGPEHILLGLLAEREGIAAGTLDDFGITLDIARVEVFRLRDFGPGTAPLELSLGELADIDRSRQEIFVLIDKIRWTPERIETFTRLLTSMIEQDSDRSV